MDKFDAGTFFERSHTGKNSVVIDQHKLHANDITEINVVTIFDKLANGRWNSVSIKSGLDEKSISFGVILNDDILEIDHLGLYMMFALRGQTPIGSKINITHEDAEFTELDGEDVVHLLAWTSFAWQSCVITKSELVKIMPGPFSNPRWSIGRVRDQRATPFFLSSTKSSLYTVDPVLATITSLTLNIHLTISSTQKKADLSQISEEIKAMCIAAAIDLDRTSITTFERNGVSMTMIAPLDSSMNASLKPYVKNITLLNGTESNKSYASYGQLVRSTRPNLYHISGVFAFMYNKGISSRPCDVRQNEATALSKNVDHLWIERFLKHLSDMKLRLNGPSIQYSVSNGKVFVQQKEVDSIMNLLSRSLCSEFALSKNAIYHPDNKNICARCSIVYIDAISCGHH